MPIYDQEPRDVAVLFKKIHEESYSKISLNEFANAANSQNIQMMNKKIDAIGHNVRDDILLAKNQKEQTKIYNFYVKLMYESMNAGDFHMAMLVSSTLNDPSISKLSHLNEKNNNKDIKRIRDNICFPMFSGDQQSDEKRKNKMEMVSQNTNIISPFQSTYLFKLQRMDEAFEVSIRKLNVFNNKLEGNSVELTADSLDNLSKLLEDKLDLEEKSQLDTLIEETKDTIEYRETLYNNFKKGLPVENKNNVNYDKEINDWMGQIRLKGEQEADNLSKNIYTGGKSKPASEMKSMYDQSPKEVALAFKKVNQEMILKINEKEFENDWVKNSAGSPNIKLVTENSNFVINKVKNDIVLAKDEDRQKIYNFYVKLMNESMKVGDFNTALNIVSALRKNDVENIKSLHNNKEINKLMLKCKESLDQGNVMKETMEAAGKKGILIRPITTILPRLEANKETLTEQKNRFETLVAERIELNDLKRLSAKLENNTITETENEKLTSLINKGTIEDRVKNIQNMEDNDGTIKEINSFITVLHEKREKLYGDFLDEYREQKLKDINPIVVNEVSKWIENNDVSKVENKINNETKVEQKINLEQEPTTIQPENTTTATSTQPKTTDTTTTIQPENTTTATSTQPKTTDTTTTIRPENTTAVTSTQPKTTDVKKEPRSLDSIIEESGMQKNYDSLIQLIKAKYSSVTASEQISRVNNMIASPEKYLPENWNENSTHVKFPGEKEISNKLIDILKNQRAILEKKPELENTTTATSTQSPTIEKPQIEDKEEYNFQEDEKLTEIINKDTDKILNAIQENLSNLEQKYKQDPQIQLENEIKKREAYLQPQIVKDEVVMEELKNLQQKYNEEYGEEYKEVRELQKELNSQPVSEANKEVGDVSPEKSQNQDLPMGEEAKLDTESQSFDSIRDSTSENQEASNIESNDMDASSIGDEMSSIASNGLEASSIEEEKQVINNNAFPKGDLLSNLKANLEESKNTDNSIMNKKQEKSIINSITSFFKPKQKEESKSKNEPIHVNSLPTISTTATTTTQPQKPEKQTTVFLNAFNNKNNGSLKDSIKNEGIGLKDVEMDENKSKIKHRQ